MSKLKIIKKNKFLYWFYKVQKIFKGKKPNTHYAEFAEDIMINRIFKNFNSGFYIDIGAYHPYKGSLTYYLYKKGWRGINIDISKVSIDLFNISRQRDININCAISNYDGETVYYENSEINQQNSLSQSNDHQKKIKIKCYKLNTVLNTNNINNIDFINIDTEGNELEILESIDFEKIDPLLITIEDNSFELNNKTKIKKINFMKTKNYELLNVIGVTLFFVKKSSIKNLKNLTKI